MADPSKGKNPNEKQGPGPLHNFNLPEWGLLDCKKPSPSGANECGSRRNDNKVDNPIGTTDEIKKPTPSGASEGGSKRNDKKVDNPIGTTDEIDEMSQKVPIDLNIEPDEPTRRFLEEGEKQKKHKVAEEEEKQRKQNVAKEEEKQRKQNVAKEDEKQRKQNVAEEKLNATTPYKLRSKGKQNVAEEELNATIWPQFRRTLTKEEIEADFLKMTGKKPPRYPLSRPQKIQRKFDNLVPGSGLSDVKPENYEAGKE